MSARGPAAVVDPDGSGTWHSLSAAAALRTLESSTEGLDRTEALLRLERHGPNRLPRTPPTSWWRILFRQVASIVVALLGVAALAALLMGEAVEAAAIGAVLLLNTALGFAVELRARRALEALLRYQPLTATVLRAGVRTEVDAADLVPGDVIALQEGESVPADARVVEANELRCVEAALTGESMPVTKTPDPVAGATPLAERRDMVYAGTSIAAGAGLAVVVATGIGTELGRIGGLLGRIEEARTPLERRLDALGRRLVWITLAVAAAVAVLGWLRGQPVGLMLETAVALAVAAVPEGLPAVATIALAVGLRRMARRNALVRRLHAVEALGSTTVVCTDKTGTLTAGEMTVTRLVFADREVEVTGAGYSPEGGFAESGDPISPDEPGLAAALETAILTARAQVTESDDGWSVRGDPTDAALLVLGRKGGIDREAVVARRPARAEIPFSNRVRLSASFHDAGGSVHAFVKGAPADVLERCDRVLTAAGERALDADVRAHLSRTNDRLADEGLRVIALARGQVTSERADALAGLTFLCMAALSDPPAGGVAETLETLDRAGIRTIMITGDQARTAATIARQLGLAAQEAAVVSGHELEGAGDDEIRRRLEGVNVFSRIGPETKLDIVRVLQNRGEIVAMLGDGVNDAAALKRADVGVAMGGRGTDVAREVASIVLQDDRFATIGAAVEEGRVIYDNIRKFIFYLFSCNLAEVLVLLVAGAAALPLPLFPLQILWLNLVTDTFPALALAMEPGEPEVMARPPREPSESLMSGHFVRAVGYYAALITAVTLAAFLWGLEAGDYGRAVTLAFATLAFAQLFHLGNARSTGAVLSSRRMVANRYALGAVVLVVLLQLAALYYPPLTALLDLEPLPAVDLIGVAVVAAIPAAVGQLLRVRRGGDVRGPRRGAPAGPGVRGARSDARDPRS